MQLLPYDIFRIIFYVMFIGFGGHAFFIKKRSIDFYIFFYGLIYLIGTILDTYLITSNLELIAVQELVISGVWMHFMHRYLKWTKVFVSVWVFQCILLIASCITTIDYGVMNEAVIYLSNYQLLDTNESHKINMLYALVLQVLFLATIYKVIRDEEWDVTIRVYLVYAFIFFLGQMDIFIFNMITPLMYEQIEVFYKVSNAINPIIFGFMNMGLLLNLLWKRLS